jgi:hypothetical protein
MSFMDQKDFAPTNGIQEMSFDEIDAVIGGDGVAAARGASMLVEPLGLSALRLA